MLEEVLPKLKSRLENQGQISAMPHGQQDMHPHKERPTRQNNTMLYAAADCNTQQAERPVSPRLYFGTTTTQGENGGTTARRPDWWNNSYIGYNLKNTRQVKWKEQSIKIPGFLLKK